MSNRNIMVSNGNNVANRDDVRSQFCAPTIFDLFASPLSEFGSFFSPLLKEDSIKVDLKDCGDHYQLKADMPGVRKEDIHVDFKDGTLSISASHNKSSEKKDDSGYIVRERTSGSYFRSFYFDDVDAAEGNINAAFANGELDVSLKKQEKKQPSATAIKIN